MTASNQNLSVSYIKFTNVGTIANTDLANIKLMNGSIQIGSTAAYLSSDGTAIFDFSSSPLAINAGTTVTLTIVADIVGGTGKNFRFTVQEQSDIAAKDINSNVNIKPYTTTATGAGGNTFVIIQPLSSGTPVSTSIN